MRKWLTLLPAAMLLLGAQTAYAADDKKSVMGNVCVPTSYKKDDTFQYKNGGIFNRSKSRNNRENVDCPLLRDRHSPNISNEVDEVRVYVNNWSRARKAFQCFVFVRNLITGSVVDSANASTSANGNQTLNLATELFPIDYVNRETESLYVRCKVPARGTVRGIYWEEDIETDTGELE